MDWLILMGIWTGGAIATVGVLEWIKHLFPKVPKKFWFFLLPFIAFGITYATKSMLENKESWIYNGIGIWALSQLGYQLIIKKVKDTLKKGSD